MSGLPATCHPDEFMHANGLCRACYQADWRLRTGRSKRSFIREQLAGAAGDGAELAGKPLSVREVEVLVAYGRSGAQKEIAVALGLSVQTVKNYLARAYQKLGAENAIDAFHRLGWLSLPDEANIAALRWDGVADELEERARSLRADADALLSEIADGKSIRRPRAVA